MTVSIKRGNLDMETDLHTGQMSYEVRDGVVHIEVKECQRFLAIIF
jgi:hypothetical protein